MLADGERPINIRIHNIIWFYILYTVNDDANVTYIVVCFYPPQEKNKTVLKCKILCLVEDGIVGIMSKPLVDLPDACKPLALTKAGEALRPSDGVRRVGIECPVLYAKLMEISRISGDVQYMNILHIMCILCILLYIYTICIYIYINKGL